jgi:hypothetical protein
MTVYPGTGLLSQVIERGSAACSCGFASSPGLGALPVGESAGIAVGTGQVMSAPLSVGAVVVDCVAAVVFGEQMVGAAVSSLRATAGVAIFLPRGLAIA